MSGTEKRNGPHAGPVERWSFRLASAAWLIFLWGCLTINPAVIWPALAATVLLDLFAWRLRFRRWRGGV